MFPDFLDGAKVLEYTEPGHFGFITDYDDFGNPVEREIRYLALCVYTGDANCCLFYCDEDFEVISDFYGDTIAGFKGSCPRAVWLEKHPPYLYNAAQRKAKGGTCYFEFQRGRFRGKHWLERSLFLDADRFDHMNLYEIFREALPHFDYYYVTEVTQAQYEKLKALALARGGETAELFRELDHWAENCYLTENVFTICGI
ncbi:MAG: hypothetical protein E7465_08605 [Ruminococcaceae bacterium]|nr:hypothetical protein [Oscillospiraceae bacterium]